MGISKFEFRKIIKNPMTIVAFLAVIILNVVSLLVGGWQDAYSASAPAFLTNIATAQENGAYFAGAINDEWSDKFHAEVDAFINDPKNWVSDEEKEKRLQQYLANGLSLEYIENLGNFIYLTQENLESDYYNRYESMSFSSKFYYYANDFSEKLGAEYRQQYPGLKGDVLASKAEEMYDFLAEEYTAYYNYDLGYQKMRNMQQTYPFTIGLLILIGLAPIFSAEYSRRTDSLLLSSKYGKSNLIYAKIKSGLLFALIAWATITVLNIVLIMTLYGVTGWEAHWQNWVIDWAPFAWNQGQVTLVALLTSLLGAVFLALTIMLISAFAKSQYASLIFGAVLLYFPILDFAFANYSIFNTLYYFLPTKMLIGISQWQSFNLVFLFRTAIPIQYLALAVAVFLSLIFIPLSKRAFANHQIKS